MQVLGLPVTAMALMLGACGSLSLDSIPNMIPKASDFTSFEFNPYSKASMGVASTFKRTTATAADFVNADGSCAGAAAPEGASEQPVTNTVALQTTECAAVRILGAPEKIDIGANERGERTAQLLYTHGDRPGLYYFTAGQLTQIERVAAPEPPPKPKKPAAKPARRPTT
jgi:hypothetical protein